MSGYRYFRVFVYHSQGAFNTQGMWFILADGSQVPPAPLTSATEPSPFVVSSPAGSLYGGDAYKAWGNPESFWSPAGLAYNQIDVGASIDPVSFVFSGAADSSGHSGQYIRLMASSTGAFLGEEVWLVDTGIAGLPAHEHRVFAISPTAPAQIASDGTVLLLHMQNPPKDTSSLRVPVSNGLGISSEDSKFGGTSLGAKTTSSALTVSHGLLGIPPGVDFTFEFWYKQNPGAHDSYIIMGAGFTVYTNSGGGISATVGGSSSPLGTLVAGEWNHIAFGARAGKKFSHLNGIAGGNPGVDTSYGFCYDAASNFSATGVIRFGSLNGSIASIWGLDGYIDEVRLTRGVCRYTDNFTPPTEPFPDYFGEAYINDNTIKGGVYGMAGYGFGSVGVIGQWVSGGGGALDFTAYTNSILGVKAAKLGVEAVPTGSKSSYRDAVSAAGAARAEVLAPLQSALGLSGNVTKPGKVFKSAVAAERVVRIYDQISGELVASTMSNTDGTFSFPGVAHGDYYLTAHDIGTINNTAIIQNITI